MLNASLAMATDSADPLVAPQTTNPPKSKYICRITDISHYQGNQNSGKFACDVYDIGSCPKDTVAIGVYSHGSKCELRCRSLKATYACAWEACTNQVCT